jgi:ABC-2 type transport system ATP-binding protein
MFDEPHLGLDAPSRVVFYDELLADYLARPRTVIVSTHLIDEVAPLLEDVVILHEGRVRIHASAEDLRARGAEVTGPADRVDAWCAPYAVLSERQLGPTKAVVVDAELDDTARSSATAAGLDIGPIPLQDLFIGLTAKEHTP